MKSNIFWKKGALSQTCHLFSSNAKFGSLRFKTWCRSADAIMNGKSYRFQMNGFITQKTQIIDIDNNTVVGKVTYHPWKSKATMQFENKWLEWRFDNAWHTKWSLMSTGVSSIIFSGSSNSGRIECDRVDDVLVLTGLYINYYYKQVSAVIMMAVFLPIILSNIGG